MAIHRLSKVPAVPLTVCQVDHDLFKVLVTPAGLPLALRTKVPAFCFTADTIEELQKEASRLINDYCARMARYGFVQ